MNNRMETTDEQLKKSLALFDAYLKNTPKEVIEQTLKEIGEIGTEGPTVEEYFAGVAQDYYSVAKQNKEMKAKISRLESTLEAAERLFYLWQVDVFLDMYQNPPKDKLPELRKEALEKYNQLKSNLK